MFDWVVEWNNAMGGGRTGEDGRGSNGQKPDLSNAKKLSPEEQEKLTSRRKKSKLLDDTMSAFDKIAKDEGKSLKYYKIGGNTAWAEEDKDDKNQYNIYLPEGGFDGSSPEHVSLYIHAHEYYHFTEWLTGDLNGNVHSSFTHDGVTYNFLEDEFQALQFGNSVLLDYHSSGGTISEFRSYYIFYDSSGNPFRYTINVPENQLFNDAYTIEHYRQNRNYKR